MKDKVLYIASFVAVVIVFHVCYGLQILIPTNISWLMTAMHDWGTHYLGWLFYKNEPWQFPIGNVSNYFYPVGTNVGFTDSIPLLAIFFKLFKGILPQDFQYFGIWLFSCHALAAYFTIRLLQLFSVKNLYIFLAVILIAANPILVYRGLHPALCAHWLIIASLYVYFLDPAKIAPQKILRYQLLLLICSALVNPYLCCMILGFTFITPLKLGFFDKVISKARFVIYQVVSILCLVVSWYLIGMLTFKGGEDFGVQSAYGLYSLNLNALYNASGFSSILPQFSQVSWHQYEGFMYLGMGMFLLLLTLLLYWIYTLIKKQVNPNRSFLVFNNTRLVPLYILLVIAALFAITHVVSLNDKILFTLPSISFINKVGDIFRASARFFWIPYYAIFLFAIIAISRMRIKPVVGLSVLIAAVLVQLYDTKPLLTFRHLTYGSYATPLDNKNWTTLMQQFKEITFYPPFEASQLTNMDYQYFCFLAGKLNKPINLGYVARSDNKSVSQYTDSLKNMLSEGRLAPGSLYVFTAPRLNDFSMVLQSDEASLSMLNNYYFLYDNPQRNDSLQQLTQQLSAANKVRIDSTLNTTSKKSLFTEINPPAETPGNTIRYFFDKITIRQKYLLLDGWAFVDTSNNNKGDSVFITLTTPGKSYISGTQLKLRPDLTSAYKKAYIDHAGFTLTSYFDSVQKGEYQAGIIIKKAGGQLFYQLTEHRFKIGISEYASPEKINRLPATGTILHNVDELTTDNNVITISGWGAFENQDATGNIITLLLINGEQYYQLATDKVARPDVTASVKNKYQLDNSGFKVKILESALPKGNYRIGIAILNKKTGDENMVLSSKEITIN